MGRLRALFREQFMVTHDDGAFDTEQDRAHGHGPDDWLSF